MFHDSAAALAKDGHMIASVEQERLDRIKHSNAFPPLSVRCCLDKAAIRLSDLDHVDIYFSEDFVDMLVGTYIST